MTPRPDDPAWWRTAVIYQVYVRSFADSDGDGVGDLEGVRRRLPYLAELGADAVWFTPWYPSPMADGGYDVADYRDIEPVFGTLGQAERLIEQAHRLGLRTIVDIVPNHVSDQHPWFVEALRGEPGSPARQRFWFHPGKGTDGDEKPTHWVSSFSGDTWSRTTGPDGTPGEWYLHLFTPQQPDLNWTNPQVRAEHEDVLRFWFDRGVAGVRIDSAAMPVKDPDLKEVRAGDHPFIDRDELHDIYRGWRAVADSYDDDRILVGELWLDDAERFARYLRPDEMHTAFNFDFMARPWEAKELRASIETTLAAHEPVKAPATWVLSNHDVTRPVTRYGRADSSFSFGAKRFGTPTDHDLGTRRARAAALLAAALPGCLYIYQGDELGLPEVEDIPLEKIQDPMHFRSNGIDPGRDGCRVPLPWTSTVPEQTWLPQPDGWGEYSVEKQQHDPGSMLSLYREMLRLRRSETGLRTGGMRWLPSSVDVIAFAREVNGADGARDFDASSGAGGVGNASAAGSVDGAHNAGFACVVNLGTASEPLPPHCEVLLTSGDLVDGRLPADTAAWIRLHND